MIQTAAVRTCFSVLIFITTHGCRQLLTAHPRRPTDTIPHHLLLLYYFDRCVRHTDGLCIGLRVEHTSSWYTIITYDEAALRFRIFRPLNLPPCFSVHGLASERRTNAVSIGLRRVDCWCSGVITAIGYQVFVQRKLADTRFSFFLRNFVEPVSMCVQVQ